MQMFLATFSSLSHGPKEWQNCCRQSERNIKLFFFYEYVKENDVCERRCRHLDTGPLSLGRCRARGHPLPVYVHE